MGCRFVALVLTLIALACQASNVHAWSRDPSTNDPVCVALNEQSNPRIVGDAAGNYFVTWHDARSGNFDIYMQKYDRTGAAQWGANGIPLFTQPATQTYPQIVSDGAGGIIIAWTDLRGIDYDIYAQKVNSNGVPVWGGGVPVCTATGNQWHLEAAPDGLGGMLLTWTDWRNGLDSDVYAQRVDNSGNRLWTTNGVAIATTSNTEELPQVVGDGAGGAYIAWMGWGLTSAVQRVSAAGALQWGAAGISLNFGPAPWTPRVTTDNSGGVIVAWMATSQTCAFEGPRVQRFNSAGVQQWIAGGRQLTQHVCGIIPTFTYVDLCSDGAGGAFVVWSDERMGTSGNIYAQKVDAAGIVKWANNGLAVCTAPGDQEGYDHPVVPDGKGGAILAWDDARDFNNPKVYVQRIDVSGVATWGFDGLPISSAANTQARPAMVSDGRGGAVVVWDDTRGGGPDVFMQRLDYFGQHGDPAPAITLAKDLPNDQGGHVRVRWNRSFRDTLPNQYVTTYGVWRQVTEAAATSAIAGGARMLGAGETSEDLRGTLRAERTAAQVTWWECIGSIPARAEPWYTFVAETFQDSTSTGNPLTTFMVDAHDPYANAWWTSFSATGYSVDNLPPAIPTGFASILQAGTTLSWNQNLEDDLAAYRVYRGATADFVPSPANRIATVSTTGHTDPATGSVYKLSAVDVHGNESGFATVASATGIGGDPRLELSLGPPSPNPAQGSVRFRYALPREGPAALTIHDAQGRLVRRLSEGIRPAGEATARWDVRNEQGSRVSGGLYWVRLEAEGRQIVRRLVVLQ